MKHFPDFRRTLNELQKYSLNGDIDIGILSQVAEINIQTLMEFLKNKEHMKIFSFHFHIIKNCPIMKIAKIVHISSPNYKK